MDPVDLLHPDVHDRIELVSKLLGRYPARCYAQRVVGQPETGGLTQACAMLITSMSDGNFLQCYLNLCKAHVNAMTITPQQKQELYKKLA